MRYEAPETIKAAVGLLIKARGQSRILAGGTDLMVQMRSGMLETRPDHGHQTHPPACVTSFQRKAVLGSAPR